jgi:hypothetical protein
VPESFVISNRKAKDVVKQIAVFESLTTTILASAGYVTTFLDLIDNDEDVV